MSGYINAYDFSNIEKCVDFMTQVQNLCITLLSVDEFTCYVQLNLIGCSYNCH